jgi:hypothetical protein
MFKGFMGTSNVPKPNMAKTFVDISKEKPDLNSYSSRSASEEAKKDKTCWDCKLSSAPVQKIYQYEVATSSKCEYRPRIVCDICLSKRGKISEDSKSSKDSDKNVYPVLNEQGKIIDGIHGISIAYRDEGLERAFVSKYGYQYAPTNTWDNGGELKPHN